MRQTPAEVIIANLAFVTLWVCVVIAILLAGRRWQRVRGFRDKMVAQWKPALAIAILFLISFGLGGRGWLNPYVIAMVCQSLVGLAFAHDIVGYEPLPVAQALLRRERLGRSIVLLVVVAIVAGIVGLFIGSVGISITQSIFHETNRTHEAAQAFSMDKWQAFFSLLAGAGIAEETTYRLVTLSIVWRLTRRQWLAIIASAALFAAYHLTPLDGMYLTFWKFPISQFLGSVLIGTLWGFVFVKRGYETTVLGHTLSDWITVFLFI